MADGISEAENQRHAHQWRLRQAVLLIDREYPARVRTSQDYPACEACCHDYPQKEPPEAAHIASSGGKWWWLCKRHYNERVCQTCTREIDLLQDAPGGAKVCQDCNDVAHAMRLARLNGVTEADIQTAIKHVKRELGWGPESC